MVAPDQTCGVTGRFIGENVALLRDVVDTANELSLPVCLLSLDQEKAFDCVDWPFLFSVLSRMGFGNSFITWVKLLYTDIRSSVFINGYTSRPFHPSRGVRQSCPLSPLLYVPGSPGNSPLPGNLLCLMPWLSRECGMLPLLFLYLLGRLLNLIPLYFLSSGVEKETWSLAKFLSIHMMRVALG